jgi:CelD/BcsL family acetyltransferase involved in cellulose biosynthesis
MNFFSSDPFLESLAEAHFAGRRCEIRYHQVEGRAYRLLTVDGQAITDWPFLDFVEPLTPEDPAPVSSSALGYLPRAMVGRVPVDGSAPTLGEGQQVAPLVDWSGIPTWADFEKHVGTRRSRLLSDSAKRERKLAAEVGPVSFVFHEPSEEAFSACVEWKSTQYLATGGTAAFFLKNLPLFQALRRREVLVMSALRAGGKLLAVAWSGLIPGRLGYWVPAYDPSFASYSPGRLLLHAVLAHTQKAGFRELDLLLGDEDYKWHYASHSRIVAPVGRPPLRVRLEKGLKRQVKEVLGRYPRALEAARRLKRRLER